MPDNPHAGATARRQALVRQGPPAAEGGAQDVRVLCRTRGLPRNTDLQIGERDLLSATQCAQQLCTGLVGVSGGHFDVVIDPTRWGRFIVLAGDGNSARSFELAADLKASLEAAVLKVLVDFGNGAGRAA